MTVKSSKTFCSLVISFTALIVVVQCRDIKVDTEREHSLGYSSEEHGVDNDSGNYDRLEKSSFNDDECKSGNCKVQHLISKAEDGDTCPTGQGMLKGKCKDCDCGGKQHSCTFKPRLLSNGEKCICASGYGVEYFGERCGACDCGGLEFNCTFSIIGKTCECGKNYKEKKGKCAVIPGKSTVAPNTTTVDISATITTSVTTSGTNLTSTNETVSTSTKATTPNEKNTTNEDNSTNYSKFLTTPESNITVDPNTTTVDISAITTAFVTTPGTNLTSTNETVSTSTKATTPNEKNTTNEDKSTNFSESLTTPESNTTVDPNTTTVDISAITTALVTTPETNLTSTSETVSTSTKATTPNEKNTTNEDNSTNISESLTTPESNTTVDPNTTTVDISTIITAAVTTTGTNLTSPNDLASSSGTWISASDTSTPFKISSTTNSTSESTSISTRFASTNSESSSMKVTTPDSTSSPTDYCVSNPCKNGGNCSNTADGYKCACEGLFGGVNCTEDIWCTEGDGKTLCNGTQCFFDRSQGIGRCECPTGHYFDYSKSVCAVFDNCPLIANKCTKPNELCKNNDCICRVNYSKKNETCAPNYCAVSKCAENEACSEDANIEGNVVCSCKEGFYFNGTECVKVDICLNPGLKQCQHICNSTSGICSCEDGFTLQDNGKDCKITKDLACKTNCGKGECIRRDGKDVCVCPLTHVLMNGTCVDKCTANKLPKGLCPDMRCKPDEKLGFTCICDSYRNTSDGIVVCDKKHACSDRSIRESCAKNNSVCREDKSADGYQCVCINGLEMDADGICKSKCELEKYRDECSQKGAICDLLSDNVASCKCRPAFIFGKDGNCSELANISYFGALPIFKNNYLITPPSEENDKTKIFYNSNLQSKAKEVIDMDKIRVHVRESVGSLYKDIKFVDILNCHDADNVFKCTVEIQFTADPGSQVNIITSSSVCLSTDKKSDSCLIPPHLVLNAKIKTGPFRETDPCQEDIVKKNCGDGTTCTRDKDGSKNFVCSCNSGFSMLSEEKPLANSKTVIRRCKAFQQSNRADTPELIVGVVLACVLAIAIAIAVIKFRTSKRNAEQDQVYDNSLMFATELAESAPSSARVSRGENDFEGMVNLAFIKEK